MICNNCDSTLLVEVLIGEDVFIQCKECGEPYWLKRLGGMWNE